MGEFDLLVSRIGEDIGRYGVMEVFSAMEEHYSKLAKGGTAKERERMKRVVKAIERCSFKVFLIMEERG